MRKLKSKVVAIAAFIFVMVAIIGCHYLIPNYKSIYVGLITVFTNLALLFFLKKRVVKNELLLNGVFIPIMLAGSALQILSIVYSFFYSNTLETSYDSMFYAPTFVFLALIFMVYKIDKVYKANITLLTNQTINKK